MKGPPPAGFSLRSTPPKRRGELFHNLWWVIGLEFRKILSLALLNENSCEFYLQPFFEKGNTKSPASLDALKTTFVILKSFVFVNKRAFRKTKHEKSSEALTLEKRHLSNRILKSLSEAISNLFKK
jgi:hypothetical protein